jgi:hypothetical protein
MKTVKLISVLVLGLLATCSAAYSQGSGGGGGGGGAVGGGGAPSAPGGGSSGAAPSAGGARTPGEGRGNGVYGDFGAFQTTSTMKGKLTGINLAENRVTVVDEKGKIKTFRLSSEGKLKADKKSEFGNRKDLTLADFQAGQPVKVVFRDSDEFAMEVKVLAK